VVVAQAGDRMSMRRAIALGLVAAEGSQEADGPTGEGQAAGEPTAPAGPGA
jgi:hypothetical protein